MDVLDELQEFLPGRVVGFNNLETGLVAEELHAFGRDLIGHEYFHG
jgi:hypothetical protein